MAFVSFSVDPRLMPLLKAKSRLAAEREISHLRQEFVSPVVRGVLTYELRRSTVRSQQELTEQNEAFQDIEADVVSRINDRLWEVWENWQEGNWVGRNIFDICGYSGAAARNACTDYLRMKYPGRHKLDTALRAALEAKEVPLVRWHVELRLDWKEWRVGLLSWRDNNLAPVSLEGESLLRSELQSALVDKPQSEWLGIIAGILNFPVRYVELLDFLAVLGDVEAPYLRAAYQRIELELAPFHQLNLQPETEATRHGVLQQLWRGMLHLSQIQRAIVLQIGERRVGKECA